MALSTPNLTIQGIYDSASKSLKNKVTVNNYSDYPSGCILVLYTGNCPDPISYPLASSILVEPKYFLVAPDTVWEPEFKVFKDSLSGESSDGVKPSCSNVVKGACLEYSLKYQNQLRSIMGEEYLINDSLILELQKHTASTATFMNFGNFNIRPHNQYLDSSIANHLFYARSTIYTSRNANSGEIFPKNIVFDRPLRNRKTTVISPSISTTPVTLSQVATLNPADKNTYCRGFGCWGGE